jgi:hypothetical protein
MNQKIQSLLDGGFISINDVLEYAQDYMDACNQLDDECFKYEPEYQMTQEEMDYERMQALESMYEAPEYDGAGYTQRDEYPEYIIASTSYKLEETYIFQANENGEIHDFGEYGGLAKRWGDENWTDWYSAVDKTFGEGKYQFVRRIEPGNSGVVHMLFRKIEQEHEQEYPLPSDSWNGSY